MKHPRDHIFTKIKRNKYISDKQKYEEPFKRFLVFHNINFVCEYYPIPKRRFRADFYLEKYNCLIEIEGGIWNQGRHNRGYGYAADVRKYNDYILHGYKLLRFTSDDFLQLSKNDFYPKDYVKTTLERLINPDGDK